MVPIYVRALLPMFCHSFQSTMISTVKRSSLGLIKKLIHYMDAALLNEVCAKTSASSGRGQLVAEIVEVLTAVLDNEEDDEGTLTCLLIIQNLLGKDSDGIFLEQFAKLGMYQKVRLSYPVSISSFTCQMTVRILGTTE